MLYSLFLFGLVLIIFLLSEIKLKYIFDGGAHFEIHFVFFALHVKPKIKRRRIGRRIFGRLFRITQSVIEKSTVTVNRLSIPVNSSPTVPGVAYFGINISYPLIYAYLSANSRKLTVSENAVIKENTENFKPLVNLSLQITLFNLISSLLHLLFTKENEREA